MMGASFDTNVKRVFDENATFSMSLGEEVLHEPGPEGLCVLLDGILNEMGSPAGGKIQVETVRGISARGNWAESKSLTWVDMSCFVQMQAGVFDTDESLPETTPKETEKDANDGSLDTAEEGDSVPPF